MHTQATTESVRAQTVQLGVECQKERHPRSNNCGTTELHPVRTIICACRGDARAQYRRKCKTVPPRLHGPEDYHRTVFINTCLSRAEHCVRMQFTGFQVYGLRDAPGQTPHKTDLIDSIKRALNAKGGCSTQQNRGSTQQERAKQARMLQTRRDKPHNEFGKEQRKKGTDAHKPRLETWTSQQRVT